MKYDITALGELLIDFTMCGFSETGMRIFEQNPEGAPANVLAAAENLGAKTVFIGKVGNDMHGIFLEETLKNLGIETKGLIKDNNVFTTLAFVNLNNGERSFSFARKPGADIYLQKEEVDLDLIKNSKIFHFGSISLTDEPARSTTIFALEEAKKSGSIISYDPNYRPLLWKNEEEAVKQICSVIKYVDVIKISDEETELITGIKNPEKAADELLKQGVSCVFITLGEDGAIMKTKNFEIRKKGKIRNVVDTTGAGDSFWGAILYKLSKSNKKPEELLKNDGEEYLNFANTAAGLCVEKRGGIPAMPKLEDVLKNM